MRSSVTKKKKIHIWPQVSLALMDSCCLGMGVPQPSHHFWNPSLQLHLEPLFFSLPLPSLVLSHSSAFLHHSLSFPLWILLSGSLCFWPVFPKARNSSSSVLGAWGHPATPVQQDTHCGVSWVTGPRYSVWQSQWYVCLDFKDSCYFLRLCLLCASQNSTNEDLSASVFQLLKSVLEVRMYWPISQWEWGWDPRGLAWLSLSLLAPLILPVFCTRLS